MRTRTHRSDGKNKGQLNNRTLTDIRHTTGNNHRSFHHPQRGVLEYMRGSQVQDSSQGPIDIGSFYNILFRSYLLNEELEILSRARHRDTNEILPGRLRSHEICNLIKYYNK